MKQYLDLLKRILETGNEIPPDAVRAKVNNEPVGKLSLFGEQMRSDLTQGFPLLTSKKMFTKGIIHELLWFLRGDTNIRYLLENDVHIWSEWPYKKYREYCEKSNSNKYIEAFKEPIPSLQDFEKLILEIEAFATQWGDCGKNYSHQWRRWNEDTRYDAKRLTFERECVDQISMVIQSLKTNPHGTRHIVTAWNPSDETVLPPCHVLFQFYVRKFIPTHDQVAQALDTKTLPKQYYLDCQLYQRSADFPIGVPYNIASYAILTSMIAQCVNMIPGEFVHTLGDAHIYSNQIAGVKEQLTREPMPLPRLWLNPDIKAIDDFKYDDIKVLDYQSHGKINFGEIAV